MENGLIVRDLSYWLTLARNSGEVQPGANLDKIRMNCLRYKGFDGAWWPRREHEPVEGEWGLVAWDAFSDTLAYFERVKNEYTSLLYLHSSASIPIPILPNSFRFTGFDCGFCESEWNRFSSVFHELLLGEFVGLGPFAQLLNASGLFGTKAEAEAYCRRRTEAKETGLALEEGPMQPIGIWEFEK